MKAHFAGEEAKLEAERRKSEAAAKTGTFGDLLDVYIAALVAADKPSATEADGSFERNIRKPFAHLLKRKANEMSAEDVQRSSPG